MHNKVMGRTRTAYKEVYAQSFSGDCDLDLLPYHFQIPLCITKLWVGHEQVSMKSMHKVKMRTVTWSLFATHHLVMIIICAKLFLNPTTHNKVMGRT